MGTMTIETQASSRFFSYRLEPEERLDGVIKGMLDSNRIPGILQPQFSQVDDDAFFRFDITAYIKLKDMLQSGIRLRALIRIMMGITDSLNQSQEYLIPASAFLLDTQYIFISGRDNEVGMICFPVLREAESTSFSEFFLNLLTRNDVDIGKQERYYSEIISYLNKHWNHIDLGEFYAMLQRQWDEILLSENTRPTARQDNRVNEPHKNDGFAYAGASGNTAPVVSADRHAQMAGNAEEVRQPEPQKEHKGNMFGFGLKNTAPKKNEKKHGKEDKKQPPVPGNLPGIPAKNVQDNKDKKKGKKPDKAFGGIPGKKKNEAIPGAPEFKRKEPQMPAQPQRAEEPAYAAANTGNSRANVDFGETVYFSGRDEGTQILEPSARSQEAVAFRMVRSANGEVVNINKPVMRIGRDREYADYCIRNEHVSSQHARLDLVDGEYMVTDTNSSNGTFLNGKALRPYERYPLHEGDVLVFGNEEYIFHTR